ncbi:hypothetical protein J7M28_00685 [bacterium]|nr:hypothetical protein [bacterium]
MSNALRSTIVITVIWLILFTVGGWYVYYKQVEDLEQVKEKESEALAEFQEMQVLVDSLPELKTKLAKVKEEWHQRKKVLPAHEDSKISYNYFNWLGAQTGSPLMYDFQILAEDPDAEIPNRTYKLTGDDSFANLFSFIYFLEHYSLLYEIESITIANAKSMDHLPEDMRRALELNGVGSFINSTRVISDPVSEKKFVVRPGYVPGFMTVSDIDTKMSFNIWPRNSEEVSFSMLVKAYYGASSSLSMDQAPLVVPPPPELINPFYPLLLEDLPKNTHGLLEVDSAKLQAVTYDTAFITDQTGNLIALQVGDEVYLGYLVSIDPKKSECVFALDLGGIKTDFTLGINFDENRSGKK